MSFAAVEELSAYLQRKFTETEWEAAELVLNGVTDAIKRDVHQTLELVEEDVITRPGKGTDAILLPELPVVQVRSVLLDGSALTADEDFVVEYSPGIIRRLGGIWSKASRIEISYDHGYENIPPSLKNVCMAVAARALLNPEGLAREGIGSYNVSYPQAAFNAGATIHLTEPDRRLLDPFRVQGA